MMRENTKNAAELAAEIGCDPSTITKIKKHGRGIGFKLASAIHDRYGYSIAWLQTETGEMFDPAPEPGKNQIFDPMEPYGADPAYVEAQQMLVRIFTSKKEHIISAIHSNLKVFCERIDQENEMAEMRQVFLEFKKRHAYHGADRRSGDDRRQVDGVSPTGEERRIGKERRGAENSNGIHI